MGGFSEHPRPALPIGLGLIAGVTLGPCFDVPPALALGVGAAMLTAGLLLAPRTGTLRLLVCLAAVSIGTAVGSADSVKRAERLAGRFPAPGIAVEDSFVGTLRSVPEFAEDGTVRFTLAGRPERETTSATRPVRLRVSVETPTPARRSSLEELAVGDVLRIWCRARIPRRYGNPGEADPALRLTARGFDLVGRVKSALLVERLVGGGSPTGSVVTALKWEARSRLRRIAPAGSDVHAMAAAMLLGDRAALSRAVEQRVRCAGLAHLVAVSGLHVGIAIGMGWWLARRIVGDGWILTAATIVFAGGFAATVGGAPPVIRAASAAALFVAGRCLGRGGDPINTLVLLAALLAIAEPAVVRSASYQLTFVATGGILLDPFGSSSRTARKSRWLAAAARISLSAYAATAPLVAFHFGRLAPVGVVTNIVAAPLVVGALAAGYISLLADPWTLLSVPCAGVARWCLGALLDLSTLASEIPAGSFPVPAPHRAVIAGYYATWAASRVARGSTAWNPHVRWIAVSQALLTLWIHMGRPPIAPPATEVSVVDVGQGQAVVVRGADRRVLLVDAGGAAWRFDPGERIVLPHLIRIGVRRVDALVVTHEDVDHAGGAFAILRNTEVGQLWLAPGHHREELLRQLAAEARSNGTAVVIAERGGFVPGLGFPVRVVGPGRDEACWPANERSVVLIVGKAPARILLVGDLGERGERNLLALDAVPAADALVVGHHGSAGGSTAPFLEAVGPAVAIASCGFRNRFGHPAPIVLSRLRHQGAEIWRTDRHGLVRLTASSEGWDVVAARGGGSNTSTVDDERNGDER